MRHIASSIYMHVYLTTRGADAVRSGRAGLLIRRQKEQEQFTRNTYWHAGQRRACVGYLAQSSRPQTVSAVWEQDQRPAEKWSGQGRTSRTGDTASAICEIYTWNDILLIVLLPESEERLKVSGLGLISKETILLSVMRVERQLVLIAS